ncbi:MAG: alkaline phosphatase family protein [Chitinophagales bacterium]|nr:alkaline phosphatase family protein [Chitinophagales bacterium]MDW8419776.1 alkaline phosphatase D family protein [Chitinophagales bacterium]
MNYRILNIVLFLYVCVGLPAQNPEKPRRVAGPVIGAVTRTSAKIWICYRGHGDNIIMLYDTTDKTYHYATRLEKINDRKGNFAMNMTFSNLCPGHVYKVHYNTDPLLPRPRCIFKTQEDTPVYDFRFLTGSCNYMSPGIGRVVFPGLSIRIFYAMKRKRADFMVWLGDNVYYMFRDYRGFDNMFARQLKIRDRFFALSDFMNGIANYSIWDDHDYGWNDADKDFPYKEDALKIFKGFWPNDYSGQDTFPGTYFTFRYYDAEFFMTDNRWYLDPEGDTNGAYLGSQQLTWLQKKLAASDATFKFICSGSQVLSDAWFDDSYAKYSAERNRLLNFIADSNITGVIFLSGDKHFTELSKQMWKGYPFYDFTCSPLTSPVLPTKNLKGFINSYSIRSTVLYRKNFGMLHITGPPEDRKCVIEVFKKSGKKAWEYVISARDIKRGE